MSACVASPGSEIDIDEFPEDTVITEQGVDSSEDAEAADQDPVEDASESDTSELAAEDDATSSSETADSETVDSETVDSETADSEMVEETVTESESESTDETVPDKTPIPAVDYKCSTGQKANDRGEIKFAAGESSATITQSVLRDEADVYRFDANAGQRYSVVISSLEDNAQFDLWEPSGDSITTQSNVELLGLLEESGMHQFCLFSSARNATYTLTLSITE